MAVTMSRLSREFIHWKIYTPDDISTSTVELAFKADPLELPEEVEWIEADVQGPFEDEKGQYFRARILVGPGGTIDLAPEGVELQDYQDWMRITDTPERPVRRPGLVTIE